LVNDAGYTLVRP